MLRAYDLFYLINLIFEVPEFPILLFFASRAVSFFWISRYLKNSFEEMLVTNPSSLIIVFWFSQCELWLFQGPSST